MALQPNVIELLDVGRVPDLVPRPDLGKYQLMEEWSFKVNGRWFAIPVGYVYDGASIPRGAWYSTYSPFNPIVMTAALEHDWLCDLKPSIVKYDAAARHFRDRLVYANPVKRGLMYRAVLYFGPKW